MANIAFKKYILIDHANNRHVFINSTAELIDVETTPPTNVTFSSSGFTVGTFRSMDIIPVWVKRTVAAGSTAIENDGFVLRLTGNLFPT